jgi:Flp pilus assembly protein TadG
MSRFRSRQPQAHALVVMRSSIRERGSVTTELVLLTPIFILMLLLVVLGGRVAHAQTTVRHAAGRAARAASLRQSSHGAASDARSVAAAELARGGLSCATSRVDVDTSALRPGGYVRVVVRCTADLSDLGLLGVPSHRTFSSTAVEPVDVRRGG